MFRSEELPQEQQQQPQVLEHVQGAALPQMPQPPQPPQLQVTPQLPLHLAGDAAVPPALGPPPQPQEDEEEEEEEEEEEQEQEQEPQAAAAAAAGAVASTVAAGALDNAAAGIAAGTTTNATGGCKEHLKQGPALESRIRRKGGRVKRVSDRSKHTRAPKGGAWWSARWASFRTCAKPQSNMSGNKRCPETSATNVENIGI